MKKRKYARHFIAIVLIALYSYAAFNKLIDYQVFRDEVAESSILEPIADLIAVAVLCLEVFAIISMAIPKWRLTGFYLSLGLMSLFTGYIIFIMLSASGIPCSCGGIIERLTLKQHIFFNLSFLLLSLWGIGLERGRKGGRKKIIGNFDGP